MHPRRAEFAAERPAAVVALEATLETRPAVAADATREAQVVRSEATIRAEARETQSHIAGFLMTPDNPGLAVHGILTVPAPQSTTSSLRKDVQKR